MATNRDKTTKIILTGLMMAMIVVATVVLPIPIPFGNGYVHLGDAMIFLSVLILGWRYGAIAAGVGSALSDLLLGYTAYAPWTLFTKGFMGVIMGLFIMHSMKKSGKSILSAHLYQTIGMLLAGCFMVFGYFVADRVMTGSFITASLGIPWNIVQFSVGTIIATILAAALYKTPARKFFTYQPMIGVRNENTEK